MIKILQTIITGLIILDCSRTPTYVPVVLELATKVRDSVDTVVLVVYPLFPHVLETDMDILALSKTPVLLYTLPACHIPLQFPYFFCVTHALFLGYR